MGGYVVPPRLHVKALMLPFRGPQFTKVTAGMKDCLVFFWFLHLVWKSITEGHMSKASLANLLVAQCLLLVSQAVSHHLHGLLGRVQSQQDFRKRGMKSILTLIAGPLACK